jgi:hypothetical protein
MVGGAVIDRSLRRALPALALLAACGDGGTPAGPVQLQAKVYTSPGAADPFQQVTEMRICAVGDDLACSQTLVTSPYQPGGSAVLPSIPYSPTGETRQLVVEGWSVQAEGGALPVSRGRSLRVTVDQGGFAQALSVLLARVNAFVPMADSVQKKVQVLGEGRIGHAVAVTKKREVVVAGGGTVSGEAAAWWTPEGFDTFLGSVEIAEETTLSSSPIAEREDGSHRLFYPRVWATATAISTGQVFVAGGWTTINGEPTATTKVEFYTPGSQKPVQILEPELAKPRAGHSATLLQDDPANQSWTILFVGGDVDGEPTFEVWNPKSGSTGAKPLPDGTHRRFHAAAWFEATTSDSETAQKVPAVLIAGGESPAEHFPEGAAPTEPLDSYLIYSVDDDNMLAQPGGLPKGARTQLTATYVPDQHKVYVVGGYTSLDRSTFSNAIDVYEAQSTSPTFIGDAVKGFNLNEARGGHTATLMNDGAVLVAGGTGSGGALASIEIIHRYFKKEVNASTGREEVKPYITVAFACASGCPDIPALPVARFGHQAVFLERGLALLVGGATGGGATPLNLVTDLTLYNPQ